MPSRICVTVTPETTISSAWARLSELRFQQSRLILIDPDAQCLAGFDPIEVRIAQIRALCQQGCELVGDLADLAGFGTTHAVLHRPPHWHPHFERVDAPDRLWKLLLERALDAGVHPLPRG